MAVELDRSQFGGRGFGSSKTFAYAIGEHPSRYLFVGWQHATGAGSATYNGVAGTLVAYKTYGSYVKVRGYEWLEEDLPEAGTYDVVISFGANGSYNCGAVSFYNVRQSDPHTTPTKASGQSSSPSVNHTALATQMVMDMVGGDEGSCGAPSVGPGQTAHWRSGSAAGYPSAWSGSSREPGAGGPTTMSWSSCSSRWAIFAFALNPAGAPPATSEPATKELIGSRIPNIEVSKLRTEV